MSTSILPPEPIRNLNLIHARWGKYTESSSGSPTVKGFTFDCSSKGLPAFKDAATWNTSTDASNEYTGRTIVGKSEGIETIELVIETDPVFVYRRLATCFGRGMQADLELCYVPRKYYKSAYLTENNSTDGEISDSKVKDYFEGFSIPNEYEVENYSNDEFTIVVPRCVISGLTPAGGENNSVSNTTVKFQAEGGPIENLMFIAKTKYFYGANDPEVVIDPNLYGWPKDIWKNGDFDTSATSVS